MKYRLLNAAIVALAMALSSTAAMAQVRNIDTKAVLGILEMDIFPNAQIDGETVRLGAGARILDHDNRIIMPTQLTKPVQVAYIIDFQGLIRTIWLVDEAEAKAIANAQSNNSQN